MHFRNTFSEMQEYHQAAGAAQTAENQIEKWKKL